MSDAARPRLLLVEDSPTQAAELSFVLEDAGFEVEIAGDAERGWKSISAASPAAIVTDLVLPGESGFDLCRRVKADPRTRSVPVIVLTGESDPVNVLRGLEAGADGFMTKDHSPEAIVERIRRTIRHTADAAGAPEIAVRRVDFLGQVFELRATREQLLNVVLGAFEDGIRLNERVRASEAMLRERHDALGRANEALREANEVKERFLRAAAHDLRNPAGVIRSIAEIILEGDAGPVSDDQRDLLGRVVRQAQTLLDLLQDLLDVSALRAGKLELRAKLQEPRVVLRDAYETAQTSARLKQIELVWAVPDGLPPLAFDFRRIQEVLGNLLSNALKFCSPGAHVTLGAAAVAGGVEISVADDGPGIPERDQARLFEPFAKLTNRPTGGERSTGLGLSIVKEIVERHGGTITVESRVGEGSTFRVRLPLPEGGKT
jgi:signal transduction histidine kinase